MSDCFFQSGSVLTRVLLPDAPSVFLREWEQLRARMAREKPAELTRDEWAHVIQFLEEARLRRIFEDTFGVPAGDGALPQQIARPHRQIAVWLPNNVSLLGPLTLVLLGMTGAALTFKIGSRSENLVEPVLRFVAAHAQADSALSRLCRRVTIARGSHASQEVATIAASADLRIVFGSDAAATEVRKLPGQAAHQTIAFNHRRSEAWIDGDLLDDAAMDRLIRVFAIYGQAGCTAPSRVVVLGDVHLDECRERIAERWAKVIREDVAPHMASESLMALQVARANGWQATRVRNGSGIVASGTTNLVAPVGLKALSLVKASSDEALRSMPANIQTIGHLLPAKTLQALLDPLVARGVKRVVPVAQMHDFDHVWDGFQFFAQAFDWVRLRWV